MKCINSLKNYCVMNGIVSEKNAAWFQYGIERRLTTILIGCPFFALALRLTNLNTSIAFFFSFYYLRCRTNGFHAKSILGCLIFSLLCEYMFLTIFYRSLAPIILLSINIIGIVLVILLAPFKDPSFPLTSNEFQTIKSSSRTRVLTLTAVAYVLYFFGMTESAKGITIGIAMATFLLSLAHILNGGKSNEKSARKRQKNFEHTSIQDD